MLCGVPDKSSEVTVKEISQETCGYIFLTI